MPPKQVPADADIVNIDSSDEEDGGDVAVEVPAEDHGPLYNRSFWKAGDYDIGRISFSKTSGDLEHARVHPKFLHSNATSHKWAFGAIAEILDNAVDEIGNGATFVRVDKICDAKTNSPSLLFEDDGGGMDPNSLRKCISLGYSSKKSNTAIGQYGNGFKTSTMRLGADVIVFSRATRSGRTTQSIGLLSYTYLRRTLQDDVIVPVIDFDLFGSRAEPIIYGSEESWFFNLKTIIEWSPFSSKNDLLLQFESIGSHGTKIIIYNLWMNDECIYELNFDDDEEDIKLRDEASHANMPKTSQKLSELQSHISYRFRFSLRAYVSVLYLQKLRGFRIILRGKQVDQFSIMKDLKHSKMITYSPQGGPNTKEVAVEICIGYIKEAPALEVCGFNVYHRNRLIRPFWKVTMDGSQKGRGVVGVLEANFIQPAHDKQDFERSVMFNKLESKLKQIVNEYWKSHCHLVGYRADGTNKRVSQQIYDTPVHVEKESQNTGIVTVDVESESTNMISDGDPVSLHTQKSLESTVTPLDQICEENLVLFMRCEELKRKQAEKSVKIREMEKELEATRRKCEMLSSYLDP